MIDKEIIKIASNTENHGVLNNHTHFSKVKNAICGDEMKVYLIIEDNKVVNFKYQCKSCIYCQASVSLLTRTVMQAPIEKIVDFLSQASFFFDESFDQFKKINIRGIKDFKKIMNIKNISRKECLLLPFKTLSKALKL